MSTRRVATGAGEATFDHGGPVFHRSTSASIKPMAEGAKYAMTASPPEQYAARSAQTIAFMVKDPQGIKEATAWGRLSDRAVVATAMSEDMQLDLRPGLAAIKTPMTLVYPFETAMGQPLEQWDGLYKGQYAPLTALKLVRVDDSRHFVYSTSPPSSTRRWMRFWRVEAERRLRAPRRRWCKKDPCKRLLRGDGGG